MSSKNAVEIDNLLKFMLNVFLVYYPSVPCCITYLSHLVNLDIIKILPIFIIYVSPRTNTTPLNKIRYYRLNYPIMTSVYQKQVITIRQISFMIKYDVTD